jgi:Flp pilus assembly pilin Flp
MIARLRRAARSDDGASAVEFALLVPFLLLITFGIITFGMILFTQITATHAAREAARQIAVNGDAVTDCDALKTFLEDSGTWAPSDIQATSDGDGGPGDELTLTFDIPTDHGTVGAFTGVTEAIPGAAIVIPDVLTIHAATRIEVAGDISQGGCS